MVNSKGRHARESPSFSLRSRNPRLFPPEEHSRRARLPIRSAVELDQRRSRAIRPSLTTTAGRSIAEMSASGFPFTATRSARYPGAIRPSSCPSAGRPPRWSCRPQGLPGGMP